MNTWSTLSPCLSADVGFWKASLNLGCCTCFPHLLAEFIPSLILGIWGKKSGRMSNILCYFPIFLLKALVTKNKNQKTGFLNIWLESGYFLDFFPSLKKSKIILLV